MMKFVTDEMRKQLRERLEQLKAENPHAAVVEAWWDGDSLFTPNPKIKTRVVAKLKEKNTTPQPKQPPSNLTNEELENHYYLTGEVEKAALVRRIIDLEHELMTYKRSDED